jgi:hypothetical protein
MPLHFKLILNEFNRRFDELNTRWDRRFDTFAGTGASTHSPVRYPPSSLTTRAGASTTASNIVRRHPSSSTTGVGASTRGNRETRRLADLEAQRRHKVQISFIPATLLTTPRTCRTLVAARARDLRALHRTRDLLVLHHAKDLHHLLYLGCLHSDSEDVQAAQLARSFRALVGFVIPCALAKATYRAYWYRDVAVAFGFTRWWATATPPSTRPPAGPPRSTTGF